MVKIQLTDHQRVVLNAAAYSNNLVVWPLPRKLKLTPGSAAIVVRGLLQKGLIDKRPALNTDVIWKEEGGTPYTLVITKAGLVAVGMTRADASDEKGANAAEHGATTAISHQDRRMPRAGSKLAMLVTLLGRDGGRAMPSRRYVGRVGKKFGLRITSEKIDGRSRVYRLARD